MKVAFSVGGAAAVLLAAVLTLQSCQTYDFEPVEPLAIAQTTEKKVIYARASKPNIMLVVDKSGSMTQVTTGANTRLTEMQAAMSTYLTTYGKTARMGLTVFPDTSDANSCGTACKPGRILQNVVQSNDVDAELQTAANQINTLIQSIKDPNQDPSTQLPAKGGTPTAPTLTALLNLPELQDANRDDFVLLLTDGLPNCSVPAQNPASCTCTSSSCATPFECNCLDQSGVLSVIDALKAKGVRTIVVGFGADTGASIAAPVLNAMAEHGGFARSCTTAADCGGTDACDANGLCTTRFYQAANQQELATALAKIGDLLGNTDPCAFGLSATPTDSSFIAVYIDGAKTPSGDATWVYTNNGAPVVKFQGALCDRILTSTPTNPVDIEIRVVEGL